VPVFQLGSDLPYRKAKRYCAGITAQAAVLALLVCAAGAVFAQNVEELPLHPAALDYAGTFDIRLAEPALTGRGVSIAVVCASLQYPHDDYRMNLSHDCFDQRNINYAHRISADGRISDHSTPIGAILAGNDPHGFHPKIGDFYYEGAAPEAQLDIYEYYRFLGYNVLEARALKADILTMSWGVILEEWWTRGIEHMAEKDGMIVVAAVGNGQRVCDPVLYPGAGANVIGVGVVNSMESSDFERSLSDFSLSFAEYSSSGPTSDERCKPDIVAPGNCLVPDSNSLSGYYPSGDCTSFAAPVVAGTTALLVQKAGSEPFLAGAVASDGGNCVIKAILMNSARKLPYWHKGAPGEKDDHEAVLDYSQGAGALDGLGAYEQLIAGEGKPGDAASAGWDNNVIEKLPGTENVYYIDVAEPQGEFITTTLVWNRHYSDEAPFDALADADSDLRLEIWAIDPENADNDYVMDWSDSINDNVEHIHCKTNPAYSRYAIVVSFGEVPAGSKGFETERYGLAWRTTPTEPKDDILWYDLNLDGVADGQDVIALLGEFAKADGEVTGHRQGDINMDGRIDITDLNLLMQHIRPMDI
jgi:subtilisin family serine protease